MKHTLLKTAVSQVKELCAVQDTADQLRTNTGRIQTYTEYCSLLISAATTYDKMFKPRTFSNRNNVDNRRMYQHEIQPELNFVDNHESFEEIEDFNVNTPISEIQAYATNFRSSYNNNNNTSLLLPSSIYQDMGSQSRSE